MTSRLLVVLAALAAALPARGDAIGPPPDRCPFGGVPHTSHGGAMCMPYACPAAGCPSGSTCQEVSVCVVQSDCGGRRPSPCEEIVAGCAGGAACQQGTCQKVRTCAPTLWSRMSCTVGGGGAWATMGLGAAALLAGAAVLLRRRR